MLRTKARMQNLKKNGLDHKCDPPQSRRRRGLCLKDPGWCRSTRVKDWLLTQRAPRLHQPGRWRWRRATPPRRLPSNPSKNRTCDFREKKTKKTAKLFWNGCGISFAVVNGLTNKRAARPTTCQHVVRSVKCRGCGLYWAHG